jgi:hypothetical protein
MSSCLDRPRYTVLVIITLVSFITSCIVISYNSNTESYDKFDYHAKNIAITTIVIFCFSSMCYYCCCSSNNNFDNNEPYAERVFKKIMLMIFISITYFIFSTVYAIYALQHDFITSSDRYSGNRKAAIAITISALINWSSIAIMFIIKHVEYIIKKFAVTHQSVQIENINVSHSRNSIANISVVINFDGFLPEYTPNELPDYSRPPSYCSRILEIVNNSEDLCPPIYNEIEQETVVGEFLMELADLNIGNYLNAVDLNNQDPANNGAELY